MLFCMQHTATRYSPHFNRNSSFTKSWPHSIPLKVCQVLTDKFFVISRETLRDTDLSWFLPHWQFFSSNAPINGNFFFCQAILVHECIWVWEWSFWIILLKCTTAYRTGGFYLSLKGAQNPRQTGFEDLIFILCSFFCCSFCSSCTFICHAFFKSVLLCPHLSEHNSVQLYHQTSFSSHFLHFCPVFTFSVNCE